MQATINQRLANVSHPVQEPHIVQRPRPSEPVPHAHLLPRPHHTNGPGGVTWTQAVWNRHQAVHPHAHLRAKPPARSRVFAQGHRPAAIHIPNREHHRSNGSKYPWPRSAFVQHMCPQTGDVLRRPNSPIARLAIYHAPHAMLARMPQGRCQKRTTQPDLRVTAQDPLVFLFPQAPEFREK